MSGEFYIGYQPQSPPGLARRSRAMVRLALLLGVVTVVSLAVSQEPEIPGNFEFGTVRTFEGILIEKPVPMLRVAPPEGVEGTASPLVLVGFGKAGLPDFARGHDGARIRANGTLVVQGPHAMIELNDPESFEVLDPNPPAEESAEALGDVEITGELVDTKCWFGVMRPATGKVHRACAIRCLSGGVPPGILVRDTEGNAAVFMLAGADGEPLEYDLEWAALAVTARGSLERFGELPVIRVRSLELAE